MVKEQKPKLDNEPRSHKTHVDVAEWFKEE